MEIELFYMLPWQRNNKKWFPDWIYYDIPITEIRKLINAIDKEQTVFNYPPFISEELRKLVVLSDDDNNKLEKKIDQLTKQNVELKEELIKQNVELKQQMERIIKYIGVEQDNKEEKDNEKVQDNEKIQDNKEEQDNNKEQDNKEVQDNKEEQDNKLEIQKEQMKEELSKQNIGLKQQMDNLNQRMDKLNQQIENIMELLLKRN
ncbi:uncharacterized protein OCT59_009098 [Rhizophagus irregularis]|uniref:uncharacterized protein n=1 Tax=Rhizophagus irregularis TaxID=588596 RepID=UPI00331680E9|nr:hypothetical protein OCT59_009098 [Rhizophagus irregularis]